MAGRACPRSPTQSPRSRSGRARPARTGRSASPPTRTPAPGPEPIPESSSPSTCAYSCASSLSPPSPAEPRSIARRPSHRAPFAPGCSGEDARRRHVPPASCAPTAQHIPSCRSSGYGAQTAPPARASQSAVPETCPPRPPKPFPGARPSELPAQSWPARCCQSADKAITGSSLSAPGGSVSLRIPPAPG